eukprot:596053-Amorphochlora_amoeboformis.AAC.2
MVGSFRSPAGLKAGLKGTERDRTGPIEASVRRTWIMTNPDLDDEDIPFSQPEKVFAQVFQLASSAFESRSVLDAFQAAYKSSMEIPKNPKRGLKILNSWGKKKMDFVPIDPAGQRVNVYVCGPTVYDSAHLGHARAYLTFDIILRILSDYFG